MLGKTVESKKGQCPYGRKCCGSSLDFSGHKRKRRTLKRRERQSWRMTALDEFYADMTELDHYSDNGF